MKSFEKSEKKEENSTKNRKIINIMNNNSVKENKKQIF